MLLNLNSNHKFLRKEKEMVINLNKITNSLQRKRKLPCYNQLVKAV